MGPHTLFAIVDFDELLATELQARYVFGDDVLLSEDRIAHTRETTDPQQLRAYLSALFTFDIGPELAKVGCPTLVVFPRMHSYLTQDRAQEMAASIPNSEFAVVDSGYYPSSFVAGRYRVERFLGEGGRKRVFLAHDTTLDRDVAFAQIRTEGLDNLARERVMREAQSMVRPPVRRGRPSLKKRHAARI